MPLDTLDLDIELRDQVTPALWACASPELTLQGLVSPGALDPGQEVPRTTQPGNLGEQGHVHRDRPPRMGGGCPEEEELGVGPLRLRG